MKGILLLNGDPYWGKIDTTNAYVVCCDGAYAWAKSRVDIDENVGDFDSLDEDPIPAPRFIYDCEKDDTDGEIGLRHLLEREVDEIEIYGGAGGREDHFLGNLHLLYQAAKRGVKASLITDESKMLMIQKEEEFVDLSGATISLLPFGGTAEIAYGEGFYYPVSGVKLYYGSTRGISNRIIEDEAFIRVKSGMVLAILNLNEEE